MVNKASSNTVPETMMVLLIQIEDCQLLLPDAAVAEIVDFEQTEAESDDVPTWYLGKMQWRGVDVPLISLEGLNNDAFFTRDGHLKIIIMHSSSQRKKMPFWAFVTMETPKMTRINKGRLNPYDHDELRAMEKMWVSIDDEPAMIPDMEKIEKAIAGQL